MAVITKDSYIKLVRFDVTKEHQITFADGVAQIDYFRNVLNGVELTASAYQRKEYKIRFPALIDTIEQYNYAIVQNKPESYKYYFYYITDMEYINEEVTDVTIKLDVFQTYQFDFTYMKSLIEREHANSDNVGDNTIPEGLETGEFIINYTERMSALMNYAYMVQCKKDMNGDVRLSTNLGGIRYAGRFYACSDYGSVASIIMYYTDDPDKLGLTAEDIINIYMIPMAFLPIQIAPQGFEPINNFSSNVELNFSTIKHSSIDGYTPTNKKLLTKEFNYLVVSNECGGTEELYFENFKTSNCQFLIEAIPTPSGSAKLTPKSYGNAGTSGNYNLYGLPSGKYPIIDSNYDYYRNWLSNNSFNIATGAVENGIQSIGSGISGVISALSGDFEGAISGAVGTYNIFGYAYQNMKKMNEIKRIPPVTISHASNGDITSANHDNTFTFYQMCIKREYAEIIDSYFSKFGYKTLQNKVPNINGRTNWNYVKTIEAVVASNSVPKKYLDEFKQMLNNGITFWHNPATFLDYTQSNSIV